MLNVYNQQLLCNTDEKIIDDSILKEIKYRFDFCEGKCIIIQREDCDSVEL